MPKHVGLFLDHEEALIVCLNSGKESRFKVKSEKESQTRSTGHSRVPKSPYMSGGMVAQNAIQHKIQNQLKKYYEAISEKIEDADQILILGPGTAKTELKQHLEKMTRLRPRIKQVRSLDYMTDNQIAAQIRKYFRVKPNKLA
jgi:hypothetical protein